MKYIKLFKENYNENSNKLYIARIVCSDNYGSGYYRYCGSIKIGEEKLLEQFENNVSNIHFKDFGFIISSSIKPIEESYDIDHVIWLTSYGHIMKYANGKFETINTHKFDEYYNLLDKYSDYKLEMLPYFIKDSMGEFVIDFFDRLIENAPYKNCWKDIGIYSVINYIKECSVYDAYNKLKGILIKGNHGYKFGKYFDHISDEDKDKADSMIDMGYAD